MRDYVTRFRCQLPKKTVFLEIENEAVSAAKATVLATDEVDESGAWIGNQSIEWEFVETKLLKRKVQQNPTS